MAATANIYADARASAAGETIVTMITGALLEFLHLPPAERGEWRERRLPERALCSADGIGGFAV